jgi:hypothetical protein
MQTAKCDFEIFNLHFALCHAPSPAAAFLATPSTIHA